MPRMPQFVSRLDRMKYGSGLRPSLVYYTARAPCHCRSAAADCGRLSFHYNEAAFKRNATMAADCGRLSFHYNMVMRGPGHPPAADCGRLSFHYN